jgi:alpha-D-ribose 1-methylphosphonate 5-triphosphate diphosphatase
MTARILTNARVVLENEVLPVGTVHLVDGRIASIDHGRSALPGAEDLDGDWLLPGLVEVHTDNLDACRAAGARCRVGLGRHHHGARCDRGW